MIAGEAWWRPMAPADIDGVVRVARLAFPDHFEDRRCFAERLALYPRGCFALDDGNGGIAGYLIAYPWTARGAPPLNALIHRLPDEADVLYLHDLALDPAVRGRGHAGRAIDRLVGQARGDGWTTLALVAVNRAAAFWAKAGFAALRDPALAEKLASYGDDAHYMIRAI